MDVTQIIISVLSGGALVALFNFLINSRKAKSDEFKILFEQQQKENIRLAKEANTRESELIKLREQFHELQMQLNDLQNKLVLFESAHQDIPLPMWLKDTSGIMLSLNRPYEDMFLKPLDKTIRDYVGNTDYDVWEKEIADRYGEIDRHVLVTRKIWRGTELIPNGLGQFEEWEIMKFPRFTGKTVIGIAGIAIKRTERLREQVRSLEQITSP